MILHRHDSAAGAAEALAAQVVQSLQQGLTMRGEASLLVPGGRTPVAFFHALRTMPLQWKQVRIALTDERWVPPEDSASNAGLVRRELLQEHAADASFLPLFNGATSAVDAAADCWRRLSRLNRPYDVVVLGMGEDGHFASLFPGSPGVEAALDPHAPATCVAMRAPTPPAERMSLNLASLAASRRLFLLVTGEAKLQLIQAASRNASASPPVGALLALRAPAVEIYWSP